LALLWGGLILSNTGTWMQVIAQSLLVLQLTQNSGVAPGIVSFAQASPFLALRASQFNAGWQIEEDCILSQLKSHRSMNQ
jgi:hypothetical protein